MEEMTPVTPVNFFQISADLPHIETGEDFPPITSRNRGQFLLPDTGMLCDEEGFAEVSMGWSGSGLGFFFKVNHPIGCVFFPEISRGDSIEVFIDTRDVKTSGYNTRFCHHFFFLPEPMDGIQAGELTHFRTDDRHDLCDGKLLQVKTTRKNKGYELQAWIPRDCLTGYDPEQFQRMGFAYRINRNCRDSQHFSVISDDYRLEEQPSLWSQLRLVK